MYVYEIFIKYSWNVYAFITYKVFEIFFYSKLIVTRKKQKYTFCLG